MSKAKTALKGVRLTDEEVYSECDICGKRCVGVSERIDPGAYELDHETIYRYYCEHCYDTACWDV